MNEEVRNRKLFMERLKKVIMDYEKYRQEVEGDDVLLYKLERVSKEGFTTVWMSKVKGEKDTYVSREGTLRKHIIR